jgi:hypothetical protein
LYSKKIIGEQALKACSPIKEQIIFYLRAKGLVVPQNGILPPFTGAPPRAWIMPATTGVAIDVPLNVA